MQDIERKVIEWLDQHSAKAIRLLKRLIGEKSTLGSEFNAQAVVLEKLRQFHMDIDVWEAKHKAIKTASLL